MDPARIGQPEVIDDLLLYRINRLLQVAGSMVIRLCEGRFGITRREWRVIALLAADGEQLSSQLAVRAQLDRARTSRAITSLVAKKLVRRLPGQSDRRQARLALTPAGRALYDEMFPLVGEIHQGLVSVLDDRALHHMDDALTRLQRQADRMVAQAELPKADRRRGGRAQRLG